MKKLLLFSLILSFSAFGEWTEVPIIKDEVAQQGFIDFDNIKKKKDGYVYWWMMTSRSDSSEKIYLRTDCEDERMNPIQADFHDSPLGKGESTSIQSDEGWTYPAPDTGMYRFLLVVCEMADESPEKRSKSIENFLMSLEYKNKINALYEKAEPQNDEIYLSDLTDDELMDLLLAKSMEMEVLKSAYVRSISEKVKSFWRYQGAEDDWTAEVYIIQDRDGTVTAVDVRNSNAGDSNKAKAFKDSIRRAVYKASPLPSAPEESLFEKELIIRFSVN